MLLSLLVIIFPFEVILLLAEIKFISLIRVIAVVLVTCLQKHMSIVILIGRAVLQYLSKNSQRSSYQGNGKEKFGCGTDASVVLGPMDFLQLLGE